MNYFDDSITSKKHAAVGISKFLCFILIFFSEEKCTSTGKNWREWDRIIESESCFVVPRVPRQENTVFCGPKIQSNSLNARLALCRHSNVSNVFSSQCQWKVIFSTDTESLENFFETNFYASSRHDFHLLSGYSVSRCIGSCGVNKNSLYTFYKA